MTQKVYVAPRTYMDADKTNSTAVWILVVVNTMNDRDNIGWSLDSFINVHSHLNL